QYGHLTDTKAIFMTIPSLILLGSTIISIYSILFNIFDPLPNFQSLGEIRAEIDRLFRFGVYAIRERFDRYERRRASSIPYGV
ncbi:MAG: hypothetical protein LBP21_00690, partial [Synergistaceae bacterium]|nr:hypothetical protein [Synergistaceae bacterium]